MHQDLLVPGTTCGSYMPYRKIGSKPHFNIGSCDLLYGNNEGGGA